jgi:hypothetical protein
MRKHAIQSIIRRKYRVQTTDYNHGYAIAEKSLKREVLFFIPILNSGMIHVCMLTAKKEPGPCQNGVGHVRPGFVSGPPVPGYPGGTGRQPLAFLSGLFIRKHIFFVYCPYLKRPLILVPVA